MGKGESPSAQPGAGLHALCNVVFLGLFPGCSGLTYNEDGAHSKTDVEKERTEGTLSLSE